MDTTRSEPTPQQAHEQLAATRAHALSSAHDRRIQALVTAVTGVTIAVCLTVSTVVSSVGWVVLYVAVLAVGIGATLWIERLARTVPRRSKLTSRVGIGTSVVLALVAVLPWLNLSAQTSPTTWPMILAGSAVIAAPALGAAAIITGRRG